MSDRPPKIAEITVFTKSAGILSKTVAPGPDGSPVSDGSACRMSSGTAKRVSLPEGAESLADPIENMQPNEALSLGRLAESVGDSVPVTTVRRLRTAEEGTISRSREFLSFALGAPAFMLLDIDFKGVPPVH